MYSQHHNKKYKVTASPKDWRDLYYNFDRIPLKESVDLKDWSSGIHEQSSLGSCAAQAVVSAYELLMKKENPKQYVPLSELFAYFNARLIEGDVSEDSGAYIRDVIKGIAQFGICTESAWPYNVGKFAITPSIESYNEAKSRTVKNYYRLNGLSDILDALNADYPVTFGMHVYPQFALMEYHGETKVAMPNDNEEPLGGHAMMLVGYDLPRQLVLAQNSFGPYWGDQGRCWIPFDYIKNETFDSWIFDIELHL